MSKRKSFRGKLSDGEQTKVTLHTNTGLTGYRIVKFQVMPEQPGSVHQESVVKIFSVEQSAVTAIIDVEENRLLGAAYYRDDASRAYASSEVVVFDNQKFNQDIFLTHSDVEAGESINFYLELEQMKLDLSEQTVATLKDIRNVTSQ